MSNNIPSSVDELQHIKQFILHWTHDTRGYLNMISTGMQHLGIDAEAESYVKFGVQQLVFMTENIESFYHGQHISIKPVQLSPLLESLVTTYQFMARSKSIELELVKENEPGIVLTDKTIMARIVSNLLQNAVKYSGRGEKVWLTVATSRHDLYIAVKNTGATIPDDKMEQIFVPYFQLNSQHPGMGLGLSICRTGVQLLGGQIDVECSENSTTFTVMLPL